MSRRFSHPQHESYSRPRQYYYDDTNLPGGSYDENERLPPGYGQLESATIQSEISMSVVTDDTRYYNEDRRRSLLRRLTGRTIDSTDDQVEHEMCCGVANVEPVMFLLAISLGFIMTSQPLFTYWARCVEITTEQSTDANDNITALCAQLSSRNDSLQDLVEEDISSTKIWLQITSSIPTLLVAPFVGSWSDKKGRKKPLLFTMCGFLLYSLCQLMATLTYRSVTIYSWYFMGEFITGLCGGVGSMFATTITIVTDDCRHKLRPGSSTVPLRIGVATSLQSFGSLLGTFAVSLLTVPALISIEGHAMSYVKAATIQTLIALSAVIYAVFFVRETHFPKQSGFDYNRFENSTNHDDVQVAQPTSEEGGMKLHLSALCEVLMEKRPGWTRLCLILSLFFIFVEFLALDTSLLFLLVKRPPFSWSDATFGYYSLVRGMLFAVGMILLPLLLTRVRWLGKDSLMIIGGIAASAASFFVISQSTTTHQLFLATGLALICGGIAPGYRSFLPRMVPKHQTARLLTLCSIIMAFCPIISAVIFNSLFNWSIDWWPGFAFFVGGLLQLVVVFGQICVHCLMRPQWEADQQLRSRPSELSQDPSEEGEVPRIIDDTERSLSNTAVGSAPHLGSLEEEPNIDI